MRVHRLLLLTALVTPYINAQTVPPAPTMGTVNGPAVSSVPVPSNIAQCLSGSTACGLTDCNCWVQLYRASCTVPSSCPSPSTAAPYTLVSNAAMTATPDTKGGTNYVLADTDPTLTAGTVWSYVETANFSIYTPYTVGPLSANASIVTIPGGTTPPPVNFHVQLDFDNASCITGNNCNAVVYRMICTGATSNCPVYPAGTFSQVTGTLTQNTTASNTHFTFLDTSNLAYSTLYAYVVTNAFLANPSTPSGPAQVTLLTPTGVHSAILNYSNASCRTASPCTLQIFRAQCTSPTTCPTYASGSTAWKALNMSSGLIPTVGVQGTSWQYTDSDVALTGNTTYTWVATNSYSGAVTSSPASTPWSGTTTVGRSNEKAATSTSTSKHPKR
jgi:hypothetical protein